jgi:DNA-binding transcriptional LysR family regulator
MLQVDDLLLMATLMRSASLSAAARTLNVTAPALSMRLKKLELTLGMSLAVRSSRRLRLTAPGEQLGLQAQAMLAQLNELPQALRRDSLGMSGELRVTAPFGFGRNHIGPLLARFAKAHPGIRLTLELLESPWPDKRDADAVVHIGNVRDSSWVAYPLAENERWLCASPAYLRAHGTPTTPRDVAAHACISIQENEEDVTLWHYRKRSASKRAAAGRGESIESVRITPALTTNDGEVAKSWAEQGLGLVLRSQWDAAPSVARGRLVRLLEAWRFDAAPIVILVPGRKGATARQQALVRFMQAGFEPQPPWVGAA